MQTRTGAPEDFGPSDLGLVPKDSVADERSVDTTCLPIPLGIEYAPVQRKTERAISDACHASSCKDMHKPGPGARCRGFTSLAVDGRGRAAITDLLISRELVVAMWIKFFVD